MSRNRFLRSNLEGVGIFVRKGFGEGKPASKQILTEVCRQFGRTEAEMFGYSRMKHIVNARHFAMWRMSKETEMSSVEIGQFFGGRDHTTVLSAVKKLDAMRAQAMGGQATK